MKKAYMVYLLAPVNVRVLADSEDEAIQTALDEVAKISGVGEDDGRAIYLDNESKWLVDGPGLRPSTQGKPVVLLGEKNPNVDHIYG